MYTFYHAPGSSSMAVHIALHEVGAAFEGRLISLAHRDQDPPEFRGLNPEGKVPTLVIDGRVLTEVTAILYYLARTYPEAGLFPVGNIEAEAQTISWMSFIASSIHPARRQGEAHALAVYRLADQRLGRNDWAVNNHYSIADIHLFRLFWRFKGALGANPATLPNLTAHHDRILKRPAVQKVLQTEAALGYNLPV
jgi:glutathione S-transferase